MDGRDGAADHDRHLAVGGLEMHARFELFCRNQAVVRVRTPEQVALMVPITAVPVLAVTVRSYRSVSWRTRTAVSANRHQD
jgi:hypothetical protein